MFIKIYSKIREKIAALKPGKIGLILNFSVDLITVKLQDIGCLPGNGVRVKQVTPFKDTLFLKPVI